MNRKNIILPLLGGVISGAVVHWSTGYNQELMVAGIGEWLLAGILPGLVTIGFVTITKEKPFSFVHWVVSGAVGALFLRILYDMVFLDPSYHNLWPFEIIFTAVTVSLFCYGMGLPVYFLKRRLSSQ